jgi:hypothetical protein
MYYILGREDCNWYNFPISSKVLVFGVNSSHPPHVLDTVKMQL